MLEEKVKLTRQIVTITLKNKQTQEVNAWVYNDLLAWHKDITDQWVLTHLNTGYKIVNFYGKYSAIRPITKRIAIFDWTSKDHNHLKSLSVKVKEVVSQYE